MESFTRPHIKGRSITHRFSAWFASVAVLVGLLLPSVAQMATLFLSPASGKVKPGQTFAVSVYVSSSDQAVNAFSGTVTYNKSLVDVTSISKSGSIVSLWVQEPSFSNANGTARFEGIRFNPGFQGNSGKIFTLNVRAKTAGEATFGISQASALANDGNGTQILKGTSGAKFTIAIEPTKPVETKPTEPVKPQPEEVKPIVQVLGAPQLSSSSHPDQGAWLRDRRAVVEWSNPVGVTGVSYWFDQQPDTVPEAVSKGVLQRAEFTLAQDGVWYAHVRLQNAAGWGPVAHYRYQVDTTAPSDLRYEVVTQVGTVPAREGLRFLASDVSAGISKVEVSLNQAPYQILANAADIFLLPEKYDPPIQIRFRVTDKAGNSAEKEFSWPPLITEVPEITNVDATMPAKTWMVVKGRASPGARVVVTRQRVPGASVEQVVTTNEEGVWLSATRVEETGLYMVTASLTNPAGLRGSASKASFVKVQHPLLWAAYMFFVTQGSWMYAVFLLFLIAILFLIRAIIKHRRQPIVPPSA